MNVQGRVPVRFGLAGPGKVADQWLAPALVSAPTATSWSVLGTRFDRTEAFARKHGFIAPIPAFISADGFFQDPLLEAVIVAAPDDQHYVLARAALTSGHPVLIEKPMCQNTEEAWQLVDLAEQTKLQLSVGYHLRFHNGLRTLVERIHQGAIGNILHMHVRWTYRKPGGTALWRASGKQSWWSLGAFGTHAIDLIRWTMLPLCGEVLHIGGLVSGGILGSKMDETAIGLLQFASGATAEMFVSVLFESEPMVEIIGTRGTARAWNVLNSQGSGRVEVNGHMIEFLMQNPYEAELEAFALSVREHRRPAVDAIEGLRNVQILEAIVTKGMPVSGDMKAE